MEAALRTAYYFLNHKKAPDTFLSLTSVRGNSNFKETEVDLGGMKIKVAVVFGISTIKQVYTHLKDYHFIEVMACPNGCVGGGGQTILPKQKQTMYIEERSKSLYESDRVALKRSSYENEEIQTIYKEFLENPLSEKAEEYLHTSYKDCSNCLKTKI